MERSRPTLKSKREPSGRAAVMPRPARPEGRFVPANTDMKILQIDIETAPNIAYVWGLFNQNISTNQVQQPGYTLCFAAKWYGQREVMFHSLWNDGELGMAQAAHGLLEQADAIIHYNGAKFDIPTLNRDFLKLGLVPPAPAQDIDLYRTTRSRFKFTSNKLDYICQELGLGAKVKHKGMEMWRGCMSGDAASQRQMETYNKRDVRLLTRLYHKLLPWIKRHPNHALYVEDLDKPACPNCGSRKLSEIAPYKSRTGQYEQFRCGNCGATPRKRYRAEKTAPEVLT